MLSRPAAVLCIAAAAAAPEAAQAFVSGPALPVAGRPTAMHRPVYALRMSSAQGGEPRSLKKTVATKFAALASALVVGGGAMPQASNAAEEAVAGTATGFSAIATKVYEDVKVHVTDFHDQHVNKNTVALAGTVVSVGGLGYVLATTGKSKKKAAPAPAPAAKPAPSGQDAAAMLLQMKKQEIAAGGPMRASGGTSTKVGTRPSAVVTGTATIVLDDSQLKSAPTYDKENYSMGDRPKGYQTTTITKP